MIKCNVTICGSVSRQAQVRTNKEGKSFVSMGVNVVIPAKSGINKTVEISVAKDGNTTDEFSNSVIGSRIEVTGILTFHKKGEILYLNLAAIGVNTFNAGNNDFIKGDMEFRGTLGNKIEGKNDKKGNPYLTFSAFSTEKNGDEFAFTWIRFMKFGESPNEWMKPKVAIEVKGELQLGVYNNQLDIACNVSELKEYVKPPYTPNTNQ